MIVAPRAEPTVVEHVSLDADLLAHVRQLFELLEPVVHVDGFPYIDGDRPRTLRMLRARAHPIVEDIRYSIESSTRINSEHFRRVIARARFEHHFAGQEQLPCTDASAAVVELLHEIAGVPRPCERQTPDLTLSEAGPLGACHEGAGVVMPGATFADLPHIGPVRNLADLRMPFTAPVAREIHDFGGTRRQRQRRVHIIDDVCIGSGIRQ